jgi:hypothetical protein
MPRRSPVDGTGVVVGSGVEVEVGGMGVSVGLGAGVVVASRVGVKYG